MKKIKNFDEEIEKYKSIIKLLLFLKINKINLRNNLFN